MVRFSPHNLSLMTCSTLSLLTPFKADTIVFISSSEYSLSLNEVTTGIVSPFGNAKMTSPIFAYINEKKIEIKFIKRNSNRIEMQNLHQQHRL